jgi:hypothetical protein
MDYSIKKKAKGKKPKNDEDLFKSLETAWNNIDSSILERVVDSMPRRYELIIKSRGPIDY